MRKKEALKMPEMAERKKHIVKYVLKCALEEKTYYWIIESSAEPTIALMEKNQLFATCNDAAASSRGYPQCRGCAGCSPVLFEAIPYDPEAVRKLAYWCGVRRLQT